MSTRCGQFGDLLRVRVPKSVGKPDAGNQPVRFDERGTETGLMPLSSAPAPFLDSTPRSTLPW